MNVTIFRSGWRPKSGPRIGFFYTEKLFFIPNYRDNCKISIEYFQTLESLESHNKNLLEKVRQLEAEKHIVEEYLRSCVRVPWCPYHRPVSPSCCKNPPIPEEGPIQSIIEPCRGPIGTSDVHCAPDNMMVANNNDNINNNMPLRMSGVDMSTTGSSVS